MRLCLRVLLVGCAAVAACADYGTSPADLLSGLYVLQSVNGADVPALWADGAAAQIYLETDTLRLSADGSAWWGSRILSNRPVAGGTGEITFVSFGRVEYVFSVVQREIRFALAKPFVCPDCDYYIPDFRGSITELGIDVTDRGLVPDHRVFSFRRVE